MAPAARVTAMRLCRRCPFPAEATDLAGGGILACGAGGFLFKAAGFGQPYEVRL